jgi:hypothetical protein
VKSNFDYNIRCYACKKISKAYIGCEINKKYYCQECKKKGKPKKDYYDQFKK